MIRRLALLSAAAVLLTSTTASAAGPTIDIVNFDFQGSPATAALGDSVSWHNTTSTTLHTSTGDKNLSLWSFHVPAGTTRSRTFRQAGTYTFHCAIHATMHGTVRVPMEGDTTLSTGGHGSLKVATVAAPSGFRYVIQRAAPSGSFTSWRTITSATTTWKTSTTGTWRFRAALQRISDSAKSGWSPALSIVVSNAH
jgi:plastocyanin